MTDDHDDLADQAESYQAMRWRVPVVDWPVDLLKVHAAQLGIALGIPLGVLAVSGIVVDVDLAGVRVAVDGLALSALLVVWIAKRVMDLMGESEETTIALTQIRHKPHYILLPLVGAWLGVVVVG